MALILESLNVLFMTRPTDGLRPGMSAKDFQDVHRYAIYYCPLFGSPWWDRGCRWVGRRAEDDCDVVQPVLDGIDPQAFRAITREPRRYGWHATLKAPFALRPEFDYSALRERVQGICRLRVPQDMPCLAVRRLGNFLALVPAEKSHALALTAQLCVTDLQDMVVPLAQAELDRRRRTPLTPRQDHLLLEWGYPFVLDEYRFHLSLTGSLDGLSDASIQALEAGARHWFGALPPLDFCTIAVFAEPSPGANFLLIEHFALGGNVDREIA